MTMLRAWVLPACALVLCSQGGQPTPGDITLNSKDGQRYVWIPAGTFNVGCSNGDNECRDNEKPAHQVTISHGFWLGQTPVTVAAWKRYVRESAKAMPPEPIHQNRALNPGWADNRQPIVGITWDEAVAFCSAAGGRLPTGAEWEYAARAGTTAARYGNLGAIAWYADNSGKKRIDGATIFREDGKHLEARLAANGNGPKPVGVKQPNAWGLYDTLGNVWQWTADWYGEHYYDLRQDRDPRGPPAGEYRTLRGGSWGSVPKNVRVSGLYGSAPHGRNPGLGVRCIVE